MTQSFVIAGMGMGLPELAISQSDAELQAAALSQFTPQQQRKLKLLYRNSGVNARRSVLLEPSHNGQSATQSFFPVQHPPAERGPTTAQRMQRFEETAPDLAVKAVSQALQQSAIPVGRLTHLITVSCSGFSAPGVDLALIDRLGLPRGIARTHIGFMGCHGALNGLRMARAIALSEPNSVVLLCAVELCSLHHQYGWQPDRLVSNALFADGAAAVVGFAGTPGPAQWRLDGNGAYIVPETSDLMSWRIGDHGFEMTLSSQVPHTIQTCLRSWLDGWLATHRLALSDIRSWAVHPGGPRILDAVRDALELLPGLIDPSRQALAEYGNLSSPTVLIILQQLLRANAPRPCVALGFGPGLAIEAGLFL